ncbi:MAG: threonine ammonia-lyase [Chitinophagales bacterium]
MNIKIENIIKASHRLNGVIGTTPLQYNANLSEKYEANIYLKREDLQIVRSYKIRGAYNLMCNLTAAERKKGIVCASAGNHAQGVAFSCYILQIQGKIYMPTTTPLQKIKRVKGLGKDKVEVILIGDTFDEAYEQAVVDGKQNDKIFVHPFNDLKIIEGQATIGIEILNDFRGKIDYVFMPIGGGGLSAGVGSYFKMISPNTKIIGVEPAGAASMSASLEKGKVVTLESIDTFIDGAAVKRVGDLNFSICQKVLDDIALVPEGKACTYILSTYNDDAIVVEPAGILSVAALDFYKDEIKGKNVVCVISGGNNDIERMPEIKERSLIYEGLKYYFIVVFPQRSGALREFLDTVLGPNDDITYFEYTKKTSKGKGPALIGIELQKKENYIGLVERMKAHSFEYINVNEKPNLFRFLI